MVSEQNHVGNLAPSSADKTGTAGRMSSNKVHRRAAPFHDNDSRQGKHWTPERTHRPFRLYDTGPKHGPSELMDKLNIHFQRSEVRCENML